MKVLVTGGAGFIGSNVARALLRRGDDVVVLDNFHPYYPRTCKEFNVDLIAQEAHKATQYHSRRDVARVFRVLQQYTPATGAPGNFTFIEGDITNIQVLQNLFSAHQFDGIIHLAAMAGVSLSTKQPLLYTQVNVQGTSNLLDLAVKNNVQKFVFGSSSSVYGNREDGPVSEQDQVTCAVSVYGATKVAGEVLCHAFSKLHGMPVVIARIFGPIFGPLQRPRGMLHQRAINYVHNKKILNIYGRNGLETAKDATYIDDQVDGLLSCLDVQVSFEIFNIGTAQPVSISHILSTVGQAYGSPVQTSLIAKDSADAVSSASIHKAKAQLNYEPKVHFTEGIRRQTEIFRLMPPWYQELDNV